MRNHIKLAISNIINHGDTDIFPFPFENHTFFDEPKKILDLLLEYHNNFDEYLNRYPPGYVNSLIPAGYNGFRWATQIDPVWNAYFLAAVLSVAAEIEKARIPKNNEVVFSYRYKPNRSTGDLFDRNFTWLRFMQRSHELCDSYDYVVICDISEFYPRIGHHRIENALKHVDEKSDIPYRIMEFLQNFTNTRSHGLPIGGPASRILAELTLNQIDRLLKSQGIEFVRYADDYHLFAQDQNSAYRNLIFLSEKLFLNQGLALQKSKTRIVTAKEFLATSPMHIHDGNSDDSDDDIETVSLPNSLLRFSIAFDPYSQTADKDYETLKNELSKFDILGLLRSELQKTKVHAALSRKLIQAVRFLDDEVRDEAIESILNNSEMLYPIYSSILILLDKIFDDLSEGTQNLVVETLREMIDVDSTIMRVDIHLAFAIRVLSHKRDDTTQGLLERLYEERGSEIVRRDIILTMARWENWYWLSDLRNGFRGLSEPEKRAFVVASYKLRDEGRHWRNHIKQVLTPFETVIRSWAAEKCNNANWVIPL